MKFVHIFVLKANMFNFILFASCVMVQCLANSWLRFSWVWLLSVIVHVISLILIVLSHSIHLFWLWFTFLVMLSTLLCHTAVIIFDLNDIISIFWRARLRLWSMSTAVQMMDVYLRLQSTGVSVTFVTGRYAIRYGKMAGEVVKKQMAHIPSGLVSILFTYPMFMQICQCSWSFFASWSHLLRIC